MKTTIALLCLGLAIAARPPTDINEYQPKNIHEETSYVPGKLYQYYYDSQLLHGIPSASSQRSGQRIQAIVDAYAESETKMAIQLKSVSIGSINERLFADAESRILRTDAFEQAEITEEQKKHLESPVVFKREHGLISALEYAQDEPEWCLNIKRSILSLMSHNLEAHSVQTPKELYCPKSGECSKPAQQRLEDMRYYQTFETTVEGNCETEYSLVQNPYGLEESVWNITKTINLGKCQQAHDSINARPEIRYNFHLADACPECDYKGMMLNSTTLVTVNVIGERKNFVIEKAEAISEYYIPDLSDNERVTYRAKVNQSLRLMEVSQKAAPVLATSGSLLGNTLMYSLNWDALKEKFFMDGTPDFLDQSPYSKFMSDPVSVVMQLLKELTREMAASISDKSVDTNAPSTFLRLVRVMRLLKQADFEKVHSEVFQTGLSGLSPKDQKAAKDLVHTAIGAAGTFPALKHISECIAQNKISQSQAVMAIRQFQNARVVSREALVELEQLCTQVGADKPALKQILLLTYGSMARTFCMPRNNKLAQEQPTNTVRSAHAMQCSSQDREKFVQFIVSQFNENSDKWTEQILALKALRNAGLPECLPEVRKIVENKQLSEIVRSNAILALEHLKSSIPKQVISVCLPIVLDRQMEPSVRMAAVHIVMKCDPSLSEMSQLAAQVNRKEDSRPVKSFIYTYLSSLANSTSSPCDLKKSEKARQVLRLVRDDEKVITGSFASRKAFFNNERRSNYGSISEVFSIMSNKSYIPTVASVRMAWKMMGLDEAIDVAYAGEGVDKAIVRMLTEYFKEPAQSRARRSLSEDIHQKLNDLTASYESFDVETSKLFFYLRVLGQDVGFLPLDKPIFEWLRSLATKDTLKSLGQEINFNWASLASETMYKIPSAMGLPLIIRAQSPIIAQLKGSIGDIEDSQYYVKNLNLMPSLVQKMEISCEVYSPIVNSGLKLKEVARVSLPIKGSLKKNGELEVELPNSSGREIVLITAEPLCFTRKWYAAEPNTYVKAHSLPIESEEHNRVVRKDVRSANVLGLELEFRKWSHPSTQESWSYPMVPPMYGPNEYRLIARKSASASCDNLRIMLNKPSFTWESTEEAINIENFKVPESHSSEEASSESADYSANAKSPFYVAKVNIEAECGEKKIVELKYIESADSRLRKVAATLTAGSKKYCAQGEVLYPVTPMTPEETTGKTYSRLVYSWNGECSGNNPAERVQIAIQSEKSKTKAWMEREYQQLHKQCLMEESPVPCYHIVKEAAKPNKHTVHIKYDQNMPVYFKNMTQRLLSYFVSSHIMSTDINKYEKYAENEIKAVIRVDPFTTSRVNITIREPGQTLRMRDINSCLFNWESAMLSQVLKPTSYSAMCTVADSHIETFDKTKFSAPVTNCWSVLAKDCSKENRFAVMMKRNTMGSQQKTLAVVTKSQRIEVSDSFVLKVNGQEKPLNDDVTKLSDDLIVQKYAGQKIKISLPKQRVVVYFDGRAAKVSVNAMYFTEQCGLCGHYNRDARDVLRSPMSRQQSSVLDFFKQYQIEIEGCQKEPEKTTEYTYNHEHNTKSNDRRRAREVSPISGYIGRHVDGEYCVCKEKKPICPKGYSPSEYNKERVTLHCISDRFESRRIAREISNFATEIELPTEFEDSTSVTVPIPSKCKRH